MDVLDSQLLPPKPVKFSKQQFLFWSAIGSYGVVAYYMHLPFGLHALLIGTGGLFGYCANCLFFKQGRTWITILCALAGIGWTSRIVYSVVAQYGDPFDNSDLQLYLVAVVIVSIAFQASRIWNQRKRGTTDPFQ